MYTNVFINISDISALDLCVAINSDCSHYSNLLDDGFSCSQFFSYHAILSRNYHNTCCPIYFSHSIAERHRRMDYCLYFPFPDLWRKEQIEKK